MHVPVELAESLALRSFSNPRRAEEQHTPVPNRHPVGSNSARAAMMATPSFLQMSKAPSDMSIGADTPPCGRSSGLYRADAE
jgi:hypothetical protein